MHRYICIYINARMYIYIYLYMCMYLYIYEYMMHSDQTFYTWMATLCSISCWIKL